MPKYPLMSLACLDRIWILGFPRNQYKESAVSPLHVFSSGLLLDETLNW